MTEWIFSLREELCVASMLNHATEELDWEQTKIAMEIFQNEEEGMADAPGKRTLKAYCGKYEHPEDAEFFLDEVYLDDGKLCARFLDEGEELTGELYPIGKKAFGRKGGFTKVFFGKDCATVNDGVTCKKLYGYARRGRVSRPGLLWEAERLPYTATNQRTL